MISVYLLLDLVLFLRMVQKIMPSIALTIFAEQCLDKFRIGSYLVFITVISID